MYVSIIIYILANNWITIYIWIEQWFSSAATRRFCCSHQPVKSIRLWILVEILNKIIFIHNVFNIFTCVCIFLRNFYTLKIFRLKIYYIIYNFRKYFLISFMYTNHIVFDIIKNTEWEEFFFIFRNPIKLNKNM